MSSNWVRLRSWLAPTIAAVLLCAAFWVLHGELQACQDYNGELAAIGAAYERHLAYCYGQETRWPTAPFWNRRRPVQAGAR